MINFSVICLWMKGFLEIIRIIVPHVSKWANISGIADSHGVQVSQIFFSHDHTQKY